MPIATRSQRDPKKDSENSYEILDQIGKGSFATVFRAINKHNGQLCAVKKVSGSADVKDLINEIATLKSCESEYIVKLIDCYHSKMNVYIVMEYCRGGSLRDIKNQLKANFTEKQISLILKDVLQGLHHLHSKNKIHRDVKCANILLAENGVAKLGDFGVTEAYDKSSPPRYVTGTPLWLPPEVIKCDPSYTPVIDIWSLGITAIEMADGAPPYADFDQYEALKIISTLDIPPPTFKETTAWSQACNDFLKMCLTKRVAERKTAQELLKCEFITNAAKRQVLTELVKTVCNKNFKISGFEDRLRQRCIGLSKENSILLELDRRQNDRVASFGQREQQRLQAMNKTINDVEHIIDKFTASTKESLSKLDLLKEENRKSEQQYNNLSKQLEQIKASTQSLRNEQIELEGEYKGHQNDIQRRLKLMALKEGNP